MSYGWIIDKDHLAEAERRHTGRHEDDAVGTVGPRSCPDWMEEILERGTTGHGGGTPGWNIYRFKLYDDDGELYYTGRMICDEEDDGSEEACFGPLQDFGMPSAGCTLIKYPGHPEMDCG